MRGKLVTVGSMAAMIAALLWTGLSIAAENAAWEATCRISTPHGLGTGCVYSVRDDSVAILTNSHVVEGNRVVHCEFWRDGHQSAKIPGQVYCNDARHDMACVLVPTQSFGGLIPKAIPMGTISPVAGSAIESVGCPGGGWATAWRGHVLSYRCGELLFLPPPANGRSGSAIVDSNGKIVGLIRARASEGGQEYGIAVDLATLRGVMERKIAELGTMDWDKEVLVGCPGGCCPGGSCPAPEDDAGRFRLFGGRQQQPESSNPWPGLSQTPSQPPVDLSPLVQGQTAQTQLLQQLLAERSQQQQQAPLPAQPAGPDPQVISALNAHGQAIEQLKTDIPKQIDAAVKPLASDMGEVKGVLKPLLAWHDKLEADAEAGGLKGKVAQQLLDAGSGDEGLRKILITGGIVLGIVALIAFGVIHLIRTGKGFGADVLDKLAAAQPNNAPLQAVASKVDALDAKILTMLPQGAGLPGLAAGTANDIGQQVASSLAGLHAKIDANTAATNQAAQAATATQAVVSAAANPIAAAGQ